MGADTAQKPSERQGSWRRFVVYLILLVLAFILGGFFTFAKTVGGQTLPNPVPKADGIVVWTGHGGGRLEAGAKLLEAGRGERLLISGVNESNDLKEMLRVLQIDPAEFGDRVDLDYKAHDTIGNARETSNWAEALGYEHIILVTSAYHMPRAEVEITSRYNSIHITPYPVINPTDRRWWNNGLQFKRMTQEYGKLLLTYLRNLGRDARRDPPRLDDMPLEPNAD